MPQKIALVSDSHGRIDRLEILLNNLQKSGIKYLIHAGDFLVSGVEEILKKSAKIKIFISRGNCDVNENLASQINRMTHVELKNIIRTEIETIKIAASHVPGEAQEICVDEKVDVFVHGHTHRRKIEKNNGCLIINPGALTQDGGYFLLSVPSLKIEQKFFNEDIAD